MGFRDLGLRASGRLRVRVAELIIWGFNIHKYLGFKAEARLAHALFLARGWILPQVCRDRSAESTLAIQTILVVVKIMVPFGVLNIPRHLICRVPKKEPSC